MQVFSRISILTILALIIALALGALAYIPLPVRTQATYQESTILFESSHRIVLAPSSCLDLRWQVDNIRAISINGNSTTGNDGRQICNQRNAPHKLRVTFQDGTQDEFTVPTLVLVQQGWFWAGVGAVVILLLVAASNSAVNRLAGRDKNPLAAVVQSVFLTFMGLLFAFVMLEVGFRVWLVAAGSERDRLLYTASGQEIAERSTTEFIGLSHVDYSLSPARDDVNQFGFRGEEIAAEKPDGEFRILTLGGSTTYGEQLDVEDAWPQQLERILRENYGYDQVVVVNGGVSMYNTWNSLVNFEFRGLNFEPDLVIVYHAINDVVARLSDPLCFAGENPARGLGGDPGVWQFAAPSLNPFAVVRYVQLQLGIIEDPTSVRSQLEQSIYACPGGEDIDRLDFRTKMATNSTDYFTRNMRSIAAVARAHNVEVMFSTWAYDTGNVVYEYVPFADEHNAIIRSLADELDLLFWDLANELPYSPDHWQSDGIHQTEIGSQVQAEQYAAYLDAQGVIR